MYLQFVNIANSNFKFKVFNNAKRLEFLRSVQQKEKVQKQEEVKEICYGGYGKFSNKPDRKYITLLSFIQ